MKSERDVFEKWYFDKHYAGTTACWLKVFSKFENLKGSEKSYNGKYINDRVLLAYEAWQASASREGYKLAPLEPTDEMINTGRIAKLETKGSLRQEYKAMIEAAL